MMTTSQCAVYCGVSKRYINNNIDDGKLKAEMDDGLYYISEASAEKFRSTVICPDGYTPAEAAQMLGITGKALRENIRKGNLIACKPYSKYIISLTDFRYCQVDRGYG